LLLEALIWVQVVAQTLHWIKSNDPSNAKLRKCFEVSLMPLLRKKSYRSEIEVPSREMVLQKANRQSG